MGVSITAAVGSIRWGYRPVVDLRGLTIMQTPEGRAVTATLTQDTNAYALAQRPLVLVVPHEKGSWRWPIEELQISGASISATLGQRE